MRFHTLTLPAFGCFTDLTLDLSAGSHGLHVVHGGNEAGKSTLLRAIRHLLFGIPARTTDGFVHDYSALRIGATLQATDGSIHTVVRRKGNKNTLLHGVSNEPIDEAVLSELLGGIGRDAYEQGFAIGVDEVVAGGQALLAGQAEVGEALFGAAVGDAARLRRLRESLDQELRELYKPRASKPKINQALRAHKQHVKATRAGTLRGTDWTRRQGELARKRAEVDTLTAERAACRQERARLERLQRGVAPLGRLEHLQAQREQLDPVVELRHNLREEVERLRQERRSAIEAADNADRSCNTQAARIAELDHPQDNVLLAVQGEVSRLAGRLSQHRRTIADRQRVADRTADTVRALHAELATVRPGWSLDDLRDRGGTTPAAKVVSALAEQHHEVVSTVQAARSEVDRIHRALDLQGSAATEPPTGPHDDLVSALEGLQQDSGLPAVLQEASAQREAAHRAAEHALAQLQPAPDTTDPSLLSVPSAAAIDAARKQHQALEQRAQALRERTTQADRDAAELAGESAELQALGAVPTRPELTAARSHRDDALTRCLDDWTHGRAPAHGQADTLTEAVQHTDTLADRMIAEVERVRQAASIQRRRTTLAEQRAHIQADADALHAEQQAVSAEWTALWHPTGVVPRSPAEMAAWREQWVRAVDASHTAAKADTRVAGLQERLQSRLDQAARWVTLPDALPTDQLAAARSRLSERVSEERARVQAHTAQQREREGLAVEQLKATAAHERAQAAWADWQAAWRRQLGLLGKSIPDTAPERAEVVGVVDELRSLSDLHTRLIQLDHESHRIAGMDRDIAAWRAEHADVIAQLPTDLAPGEASAEAHIERLHRQLTEAIERRSRRSELQDALHTHKDTRSKSRARAQRLQAELDELCRQAGVDSEQALLICLDNAEQARDIDRQMAQTTLEIRANTGLEPAELSLALASEDRDALPGRIQALGAREEALDRQLGDAQRALGELETRLEALEDDTAAQHSVAEASLVEGELEELARQALRLQVALLLLTQELDAFRERNQGPLLHATSERFAQLTDGAFARVVTDFGDNDQPVLLGERPGGGRVDVAGMSAGTRDQLYLSLRLAAVEHHVHATQPLPLVVDDVLVHFDRNRARAALRALVDLSQHTQVLLFTHDIGVVDLAESLERPDAVFLHPLGPGGAPR